MPKTILITGCSNGFGFEAAKALADRGHHVYATMRGYEGKNVAAADALSDYADSNDVHIDVMELDVTSDDSVRDAIDGLPALDVVINNAGLGYAGAVEAVTPEQVRRQFDVNVVGPARVARAALPGMRERGQGLIIQVSSISGRMALPGTGVYSASKWALEAMSESMRLELGPMGIDVCIVQPGPFGTGFLSNMVWADDTDVAKAYPHIDAFNEGFVSNLGQMFSDPDAPTDPMDVVRAFETLIDTPAGERPLRTVVGLDFGCVAINDALEPMRQGMLEGQEISGWDGADA